MPKSKDSLDDLQHKVDARKQAVIKAQEEHDKAVMALAKARTETFDEGLVETARGLGVNPDNFNSQGQLKEAVDTVS